MNKHNAERCAAGDVLRSCSERSVLMTQDCVRIGDRIRRAPGRAHSSLDSRHLARTPIAAMHADAPDADATLVQ